MLPRPVYLLIVDPDPGSGDAWAQALDRSAMKKQVYLVRKCSQAIEHILKVRSSPTLTTPGVLLVQCDNGPDPVSELVGWLRSQEFLNWILPVALVDPRTATGLSAFYQAGARSCLPAPESVQDRIQLLSEITHYWQALNVWPEPNSR